MPAAWLWPSGSRFQAPFWPPLYISAICADLPRVPLDSDSLWEQQILDFPGDLLESSPILNILTRYMDTDYVFCLSHLCWFPKSLAEEVLNYPALSTMCFFTGRIYYTKPGGTLSPAHNLQELLQQNYITKIYNQNAQHLTLPQRIMLVNSPLIPGFFRKTEIMKHFQHGLLSWPCLFQQDARPHPNSSLIQSIFHSHWFRVAISSAVMFGTRFQEQVPHYSGY